MLNFVNISMSFGGQKLFENISFIINKGEKIGLIGRNGCGKSTLFKIIAGQLEQDGGNILKPKGYRIGYLQQHLNFTEENAVKEACLALPEEEREYTWKAEKVLAGLGFSQEDMEKDPKQFSGGWQVKLNLAKILLEEPDLLMLDEPTNYLDIFSIRWLKRFLQSWNGELLLITHDRSFMDEIVNQTVLIHRKIAFKNAGITQDMYDRIEHEEEIYEKTRINEEKKREKTQAYIDRFRYKATLASRVQSRIKMLEKQEVKQQLDKISELDFSFNYKEFIGNSKLIEVDDLKFGYTPDRCLINNLTFNVEKGDKICIIGKNGMGKSTLLKLLNNEFKPLSGEIKINNKVDLGYFGQMNINRLSPSNTIEEELWSIDKTLQRGRILATASTMMFPGDLARKTISVLSGGEKSRVALGKILLKPCNVIMLDEPTNHLDMESCESLAEAIYDFEGASLIVSHNEYLLNNVANKLIVFDGGNAFLFEGGYKDFLKEIGWNNEQTEKRKKVQNEEQKKEIKPISKTNKREIEKIENLILDKSILMEEMVEKGQYKDAGILDKEIKELEQKLENIRKSL